MHLEHISMIDKVYTDGCIFKIDTPFASDDRNMHSPDLDCFIGISLEQVLDQYLTHSIDISLYTKYGYRKGNYIQVDIYNPSLIGRPDDSDRKDDYSILEIKEFLEKNSCKRELLLSPNLDEVYMEKYFGVGTRTPGMFCCDFVIDYSLLYQYDKYSFIKEEMKFTSPFLDDVLECAGYDNILTGKTMTVIKIPKKYLYSNKFDVFYGIGSFQEETGADYTDWNLIPVSTMKFID